MGNKKNDLKLMWDKLRRHVDCRIHSFTESCKHGMLTTRMQNKQKDLGGKSKIVWILTLSKNGSTKAGLLAIPNRHSFVGLRHGRARKEMCRFFFCELSNKRIEELYTVSTLCLDDHLFFKKKGRRTGDSWIIIKSMIATIHCTVSELFGKSKLVIQCWSG